MALSFRLKVYSEIISAIKNTVTAQLQQYGLSVDWNVGSLVRTVCEAAAIQDAEQYAQIATILDLFSLDNVSGDDIDRRALDYGTLFQQNLRRLSPRQSIVKVAMRDANFTQITAALVLSVGAGSNQFSVPGGSGAAFPTAGRVTLERGTVREENLFFSRSGDTFTITGGSLSALGVILTAYSHQAGTTVDLTSVATVLSGSVVIGAASFTVAAGTGVAFPTSGRVILSRETVNRESLLYTRVGDVFSVAATTANVHADADSVILSTVGADRTANSGSEVQVPATQVTAYVPFTLNGNATLFDGDFQSALVQATSKQVGAYTLVGSGQVTTFTNPPFASAVAYNPYPAAQGSDREQDDAYVSRLKSTIQSISNQTSLAISTKVTGLVDPATAAVVGFAQFVDAVSSGLSYLYVTDGSINFAPTFQTVSGREVLIGVAAQGDKRSRFSGSPPLQMVPSPGIATPQTPTVSQAGTAGATSYTYAIVARIGAGGAPSASVVTTTGNVTLSGTDYNTIQFVPVSGATSYDVYRTAGGATQGKIGSVTQPTNLMALQVFNDTGIAGDAASPPASNTTITNATAITPRVFKSQDRGFATSVGVAYLEDSSKSWGVNSLVGYVMKTDDNQFFTVTSNSAIRLNFGGGITPSLGAYSVFDFSTAPMIPTQDYAVNATTGDVELSTPLVQYDALVAADDNNASLGAYQYSTGLIAYVQKVVNGDNTDKLNFAGLKAHGTAVMVTAPVIFSPAFKVRVVPKNGTSDAQLVAGVQAAVQRVVNNLGIGQSILLSDIIAEVKNTVSNVLDVVILLPYSNLSTPAGQLPRITASNVSVF